MITNIFRSALLLPLVVGMLALTVTACDSNDDDGETVELANIVETAIAADGFNTLVAAVQAADLVETLSGAGPFTVFAPTDAAFEKLPEGTLASLLQPENKDQLVAILTYHVVPGRVTSDQVVTLDEANTVLGKAVSIAVENGNVQINNATVTTVDIEASNGVIHVIDTVLLPPAE